MIVDVSEALASPHFLDNLRDTRTAGGPGGFNGAVESIDAVLALTQTVPRMSDDSIELLDFDARLIVKLDHLAGNLVAIAREEPDVESSAPLAGHFAEIKRHIQAAEVLIPALRESLMLRDSARESATAAAQSAATARDDAGEVGDVKLAAHFSDYANEQLKASNWFRGAAFASAVIAVAAGSWLYFHAPETESVADHLARGLIIVAIASIGTYCGRLSGQHRHDGNWAATVAVQLKEFTRFMEPVTDDAVKAQIQLMFASRVLGATPIPGETTSPIPAEQFTALLSRK